MISFVYRKMRGRRWWSKGKWKREEDEETQDDLLESSTSAAEPKISEDTIPRVAGTSRAGSLLGSYANTG